MGQLQVFESNMNLVSISITQGGLGIDKVLIFCGLVQIDMVTSIKRKHCPKTQQDRHASIRRTDAQDVPRAEYGMTS